MKPLTEALVPYCKDTQEKRDWPHIAQRQADKIATVVAEWLESDEAVEVAAPVLEIAMRPDELAYEFQERQARAVLAALAAHAKGEAL